MRLLFAYVLTCVPACCTPLTLVADTPPVPRFQPVSPAPPAVVGCQCPDCDCLNCVCGLTWDPVLRRMVPRDPLPPPPYHPPVPWSQRPIILRPVPNPFAPVPPQPPPFNPWPRPRPPHDGC